MGSVFHQRQQVANQNRTYFFNTASALCRKSRMVIVTPKKGTGLSIDYTFHSAEKLAHC
jgi:hypothetical protein